MRADGGPKVILKKEKEVIDLMRNHLDKVEEELKIAKEAVETFLRGDMSKAEFLAHRMNEIDTEANYIRYDICDRLYNGAYLPVLRGHTYKIVRRLEKLADAAGACCDFFLGQRPAIPEDLKPQFIQVIRESFNVIGPLKEGVLSYFKGDGEIDTIREKAKKVRIKESDVDKLEHDLTQQIFSVPIDHWRKMHLKNCLGTIVKLRDQALEVVYELELVTMKMRV